MGMLFPPGCTSLNNLAELYESQGRYSEAEPLYRDALEMSKRRLGEEHPSVATSLNNLASFLSVMGHREEALQHAQEAGNIYRQLATERPDTFLRDFAAALNNLATSLSDLGRREEALQHAQEAVDIYRQLATERPDAFLPNLALSLNNLGRRLDDLNQREAAREAARDAVSILSPYFLKHPSAFAHWMSTFTLNYLLFEEQLQNDPDTTLLQPIVKLFNKLQNISERKFETEKEDTLEEIEEL